MTGIGVQMGFSLDSKTNRMDQARALELFDDENVIQRGHFYCISGGPPFTFDFITREYFFKKGLISP